MTTRRIVVGLDGSDGSIAARDWCLEHAAPLDAEIIGVAAIDLVPIVPPPATNIGLGTFDEEALERAHAEQLDELVAPLRDAGIPCRTMVRLGNPAGALDDIASEEDCELIVVGRRGHGGIAELLLGSVPHTLAHHARRPVVIVPAPAGS
jgi:nucleotide-binding universal stress UspA family protein